jgi:hypothetical protein
MRPGETETRALDGLGALIRFARLAAGADFAVAFEAGAMGLAEPLAADPGPPPRAFTLGRTKFADLDWTQEPREVATLALPSSILLALDRPAQLALFVATPFDGAERSGVLLLWAANRSWRCDCPFRTDMESSVLMLQSAFGQMLSERRASLQRKVTADRFHDLFETVPTGIVLLDGEGASGMPMPGRRRFWTFRRGRWPPRGLPSGCARCGRVAATGMRWRRCISVCRPRSITT